MTDVKRSYDASRRRQQALARRRAVVEAARDLFEHNGFRATSVAAIARQADVSPESVYKHFGTKAALAKAVFDFVIAGDHEEGPLVDRPAIQLVRDEPDIRRKINRYVEGLAQRQERSAKVQLLIRDGRHSDDTLGEVWQSLLDERLAGMTMFGRHLLDTGRLRQDIGLDEVRDVLWTCTAVEIYELVVLQRGWSLDRYAAWTVRSIAAGIL